MEATNVSLLVRVAAGDDAAWAQLDRLYRPFILGWYRGQGLSHTDAEDLTQEALTVLFRELKEFQHSGRTGAFRTWVRGVCLNRLKGYRRAQKLRGRPVGGTDFQEQLHEVPDDDEAAAADWDRQHDRHVLRQLLDSIAGEFEASTLQAFRRLTLDGASGQQVADELGLTTGAVYIAKSRVLRRLRAEAAGLIDEAILA